jgi:anti-sigma B factor antagonist
MDIARQAQLEIERLEAHCRQAASATPEQVARATERLAELEALVAAMPAGGSATAVAGAALLRFRRHFDSPRFDLEARSGFFADRDGRPGFALFERVEAGILVWEVTGSLDVVWAPRLDEAFDAALDAGATRIVVDLSGVEYASSAGLRTLVRAAKRLRLSACTPNPHVARILEAGGVGRVLPLRSTVAESLACLRD